MSRLTAVEAGGAVDAGPDLDWEEPKISINREIAIRTQVKVAAVKRLWNYLDGLPLPLAKPRGDNHDRNLWAARGRRLI